MPDPIVGAVKRLSDAIDLVAAAVAELTLMVSQKDEEILSLRGRVGRMRREDIAFRLREDLDANEWNIARVARIQGCTRRTIYLRMAALGIERKKVVKKSASRHTRRFNAPPNLLK